MKCLYIKDKNRRASYLKLEKKKIILQYIIQNLSLNFEIREFAYAELNNLIRFNTFTKIRNRCILTNRARAVYRKFKMSRLFFKKLALQGELIGVKKAS